jgi:hypothetical protein
MKKLVAVLIVVVGIFSCASLNLYSIQQADESYTLSYKPALGGARTSITFNGVQYLKAKENKSAEKELRNPDYQGIPTVGLIIICLNDGSIEGANPKNSLFILHDRTGKEIHRANGSDEIPDYDVSSYNGNVSTLWTAYDSIALDDTSIVFPLTLRVIRFGNETVDITIYRKPI